MLYTKVNKTRSKIEGSIWIFHIIEAQFIHIVHPWRYDSASTSMAVVLNLLMWTYPLIDAFLVHW